MVKQPTPRLLRLFERVRRLTAEHGTKTKLAEDIGVTIQTLSGWLSERYEPGGEITLHLLEWVLKMEKKKKDAEVAVTTPARKARTQKPQSNEKPSSGRRRT